MHLLTQLAAAALMVLVSTLVHGLGLVLVSRLFDLRDDRLKERNWGPQAVALMMAIGLSLFLIHMVEILLYTLFYDGAGVFASFERSLFFSVASYATLGFSADLVDQDWQLLVASEAVVGFLLLGWSTAYLAGKIAKLRA